MLEKLKRVRPVTLLVLVAAIVALTVAAQKGWTPEQIAGTATLLLGVMSQLHRLIGPEPPPNEPPATPPGAIILPFVLGLGLAVSACSRAGEAEAAYANEQARCLDQEPPLGPDAPLEQRRAAWARYDACRAAVGARWGIVETVARDGGR